MSVRPCTKNENLSDIYTKCQFILLKVDYKNMYQTINGICEDFIEFTNPQYNLISDQCPKL